MARLNRILLSASSSVVFGTLLSIGHANAQAGAINPMPATFAVDSNGVDLVNWSISFELAPISLGPSDQDPLKISIYLPTDGDTFSTNIRIQDPSWVTSTHVSASVGPKSWSFLGGAIGGGVADPGASVIVWSDSAFVYARDGTVISFVFPSSYVPGTTGPLNFCATQIAKPNGEILTFNNEYNGALFCRTRSIVSNRGYQIRYDYPAAGWQQIRNKITIVNSAYDYCDPTAVTCSTSMTWPSITIATTGTTVSYTDQAGQTWSRTGLGLLSPGEVTPSITWTSETYIPTNVVGQIASRPTSVTRDGKTWIYSYPTSDPVLGGGNGELMRIQDPLGNAKRYRRIMGLTSGDPDYGEYESPNLAWKSIDELGHVTTYTPNPQHLLDNVLWPEGNTQAATYDSFGNVLTYTAKAKPGSGLSDLNTTFTYAFNDKPATATDANSKTTEYTYDPTHRGILTETEPAPSVGAPRPVKRYSYSQHYAWIKNSSGGYVQAASPIWLVDTMKTCLTSATVSGSCAAGSSDEVTTTFDYGPNSGPNNLWLRGKVVTANGVSLRTCYGYDPLGNKIWETSPRAGLTSCP